MTQRRQHPAISPHRTLPPRCRGAATALSWVFGLIVAIAGWYAWAAVAEAALGQFSSGDLSGWEEYSFAGNTRYTLADGGAGTALRAVAAGSASVLCREVAVDLSQLPIANWRWRLERAPPRLDERGKAGDDQGLRVSFVRRAGWLPGSAIAIQYVWSQNEPAGAVWPNAFNAEARQVAAESGPARPGEWVAERRNLRDDFRRSFGRDIDRIDAVCVMSDGDQTGALVEGWYGDITMTGP